MALILGSWKINIDGFEDVLEIQSVSADGRVEGLLFNGPCHGFWNEAAQELVLCRALDVSTLAGLGAEVAVLRGHLFGTPREPPPGQDVMWTLAGILQVTPPFTPTKKLGTKFSGTNRRNEFGWFAQLNQVI
jgi:hypothetical protein